MELVSVPKDKISSAISALEEAQKYCWPQESCNKLAEAINDLREYIDARKRISLNDICEVDDAYYRSSVKGVQRWGQFMCNQFNITDPEVFYERDDLAARQTFYSRYSDGWVD